MKLFRKITIAACFSMIVPVAVQAQQDSSADEDGRATDEGEKERTEIVVVSTRVVRDGYESPTPTSVLGVAEIEANAPQNIANFVNQLPQMAGSDTPTVTTGSVSAGRAGINTFNLRALGGNRVLVLLDGRRVPSSLTTGIVDINTLPQELVTRVDTVTGGASAAWGSDAVAGVVNFTLNREFTGLKASVQGNTTNYGDNQGYNARLTGGTRFADDRGHFILSGEVAHSDGITGVPRDWYSGIKTLFNPDYTPANGEPELIVRRNSGYTAGTPGLIITSGPLAGTYFGPGGVPAQLNTGSLVSGAGFVGGDWEYADFGTLGDLDSRVTRQSIFALASYDISDSLQVYAEASYANSDLSSKAVAQFNLGNLTLFPDNAFLPEDIAAILQADGAESYSAGSINTDLPALTATNQRSMQRFALGAKGSLDASKAGWTWEAYVQTGRADIRNEALTTVTQRYNQALDAVRDANGQIVCRVNADADPSNDDPACVPYNILGEGTASDPALNYVLGTGFRNTRLEQDVVAASIRGEPFTNWAGPVSLAAGLEYREESTSGSNDPLSAQRAYFAGNYSATFGSYDVTEGFVETVIPLFEGDQGNMLDLNAAVRATNYSTSGSVTTWKAGVTFAPIEDVSFRIYQSRDIRAPSLAELFATGIAGTRTITDPFNNNESAVIIDLRSGNPELEPEEADSTGIGVVFRPQFLPGFTLSADYYDIEIDGAIGNLSSPTIVNGCFDGVAEFCDAIIRDENGIITQVNAQPFNSRTLTARGIDFEATYQTSLDSFNSNWDGDLTFRLLATNYLENSTDLPDPSAIDTDTVGENRFRGPPDWKYWAQVMYDHGPANVTLAARGISDGVYNNNYFECSSDCPTSTNALTTIDDNSIAGAFYVDAAFSYQFNDATSGFLSVSNLLDKDPAQVPASENIGNTPKGVNIVLYDLFGTVFRAGLRVQFD